MITYTDQQIGDDTCPKRRGPKEWENIFRYTQNEYVADLEFVDCDLPGGFATYGAVATRSTATNIRVVNCRAASFFGTGVVFDEVHVDGMRTSRSPAILSACVFRHVTIKGACGGFLFNANVTNDDEDRNAAFEAANREFYESVDWALDISEIKCSRFELRSTVPVSLIRRNPSEQFIMTRDAAESGSWKQYDPMNWFEHAVNNFVRSNSDTELFVAPRKSQKFKDELAYYLRLRDAGLMT